MTDWDHLISTNILRKPGEHCLVVGTTGSGKTQLLYFLVDAVLTKASNEHIVWFDSGKSSEILRLTDFGDCTFHLPRDTDMEILPSDPKVLERVSYRKYLHPKDLWSNLDAGKINVFCIEPFFRDPKEYSKAAKEIFLSLINAGRDHVLKRRGVIPLTIFIDELQWICPTDRTALCREHNEGAKWFQRNIETMRSLGIRIIASTQNWMKIRPGVRESFSWLFVKRGAQFFYDRRILQKYNTLWMKIKNNEFFLVMPDSKFSQECLITPFYGNGSELGDIEYRELQCIPQEPIPAPT